MSSNFIRVLTTSLDVEKQIQFIFIMNQRIKMALMLFLSLLSGIRASCDIPVQGQGCAGHDILSDVTVNKDCYVACYDHCQNQAQSDGQFASSQYCCSYQQSSGNCKVKRGNVNIAPSRMGGLITQNGAFCSNGVNPDPDSDLAPKASVSTQTYCVLSTDTITFGSTSMFFEKTTQNPNQIGDCEQTSSESGVTIDSSTGVITITDVTPRTLVFNFICYDLDDCRASASNSVTFEIKQFDVFSHSSFQSSNLNPQRVYKIDGNSPFIDFTTQVNQILADVNDCGVTFDLQASDTNTTNPGHFKPMTNFLTTKRVERAIGSESITGVFTFHLSATFPSSEKQVSQQFTLIVTNCDLQLDGAEPDIFLNEPFNSMSMEQTFSINNSEQPYFDFTAQFDGLQSIIANCGITIWRIISDTDSSFPSFMDSSQNLGSDKKAYLKTSEPPDTYQFWLAGNYLPVGATSNSVFQKGPFKLKTVRWCQKACSHAGPTIDLGSGATQSECYERCESAVIDPSKINCCGFNLNGGYCEMVGDDYNGVPQFESGSSRTTVTSGENYCSDIQPAYQKFENSNIHQNVIGQYNGITLDDCLNRCNSDLNCVAVVYQGIGIVICYLKKSTEHYFGYSNRDVYVKNPLSYKFCTNGLNNLPDMNIQSAKSFFMKTTGTPLNIGDCVINPSSDPGAQLSASEDITVIDKTARTFNIQIECFDLDHPFKGVAAESKAQVTISIEIIKPPETIAEYPRILAVQSSPAQFNQKGDSSIKCHGWSFGGDPLPMIVKACFCEDDLNDSSLQTHAFPGDQNCACLGVVSGFNDGSMGFGSPPQQINGFGSYCSDNWDSDPNWCYVSPLCSGSSPTSTSGWQSLISYRTCSKKCADGNGSCACTSGNKIFFGAEAGGSLDTSKNYYQTFIHPFIDFTPMIDNFQDTINTCGITFSLRASKYNSNYPTHFLDPQDIVATKQVRLVDSQQSGTFQFFIDAHGSNNYEPEHFGPFDIIVCPEVAPGQYKCGYAFSQLFKSMSFPQKQQICTHNDLPELRYGPLTNHFVSQTNNIGNCNGQSTSIIIFDPVTNFVSLSDQTPRMQALEFECEDLDFSSNDAYRTLEAENIRLEIINLDIFEEPSFQQINNISQVVDENNLPSFDFSDFIDTIQSQIDTCQITFEVWTSESDHSPSIDFTPLDIDGAKEVKLTSSHNLKDQYSFWLVSKVSFIGYSEPHLSKKLFTVTANETTRKEFYLPWKPILLDPPEDTIFEFDVWESTNHFNLTVSERFDQNGDRVSLEIQSDKFGNIATSEGLFKARQMRFDNETNVLFFEIKHSEMQFFNGTHLVSLTLKDNSQQKLSRTYQFEIQFILPEAYVESYNDFGLQAQELLELNVQRDIARDNFTAKIADVNSFGNASILFNKPMITNSIDLEAINSSVMDVYIQPFRNWHEDQEGFEVYPNLNFTWNVTSFEGSYLNFTMYFSNPYQISPLYLRDNLVVHIFQNASNFFISEDYIPFASLEDSKRTMVHDIPKQMDMGNDLVRKYTKMAYKMVLGTEIVGLFMTPLDSRHLYYVLSMVNNLQLIGHFPMISIPMPPNVFIVFQYLIKVVTFDIVTDEHRMLIKNILKIEEVEERVVDISPQMQEIGYESHKFWVSMDVICVFEVIWVVRIFLVFLPIAFLIWLAKNYETMNDKYKDLLKSSQYSFYEQQYLDRLPSQTKTEKEQEPKNNFEQNKNAGSEEDDDEGLEFDPNYNDIDAQDSSRKSINSDEQIQEQHEGGDKDSKQPMTKEQGPRIVRMLRQRDIRIEEIQKYKEKLKKPIVVPQKTLSQWMSEKREKMKSSIFFSEITILNVEAYLEFTICFFLQKDSQDQSWVAILLGIHTFLLIPGVLIWVIGQPQETLESEQFIERWGNLYVDFNYQQRASRLYFLVFLLKRILFVTVCYFEVLKTKQWLTIIILYLFNLLSCLYSGLQKPYKEKPKNRIEFVNDLFFCGHLALMMCYTGFVEDPYNQFVAGWIHIFYICVHLLYNIFFMVKAQLYSLYQLIYSLYFDPKRQAEEWSISRLKKIILETNRLRKERLGVTLDNVLLTNENIPVEIQNKIYIDLLEQEWKANERTSDKKKKSQRINKDNTPNQANSALSVDQIEPGRIFVEPLGIKSSKKKKTKTKTQNQDQTQIGRQEQEPKGSNESPRKIFKSPSIDSIQPGQQPEESKDSTIKISKSGDIDEKSPPVKKTKKPKKKKKRAKRKAAIAEQAPTKALIMEIQDYQIDENKEDQEPVGYPNYEDFAHIDFNDPNDNPFAELTPEAIAAKKEKQEKEDYEEAKKREQEYIDEKIKEVSRDQNCSMEEAIRFWFSYERIRFEKMMKEDRVYNKYQKKFWDRIEEEAFFEKTKDYFTTSPRLIYSDNDHPFWKEFTEAEQAAAEDSWYEKKKLQIEQENEILAQEKQQINSSNLGGDGMSLQRNQNYNYF